MFTTFLCAGIAAFMTNDVICIKMDIQPYLYIILGSISGLSVIFPRLMMHKSISTLGADTGFGEMRRSGSRGVIKNLAYNILAIDGYAQAFLFIAIVLRVCNLYTFVYFIMNLSSGIYGVYSTMKKVA
jgi:hypothetical protein